MSKDPAFLFYVSDFLTGTMFMSHEEAGIYIRLLCSQHQHGGLIDKESFESMVNGHKLVRSKFIETEDGYFNKRMMEEIELRKKKSCNLSANAQVRWNKYKKSNANALQKDMPTKDKDKDEDKDKNKDINIVKFDFESLWLKYPNKLGKKSAERHFKASVLKEQDFIDIQMALDNYIESIKGTEAKFIKHGSSWFNQWQDWVNYKKPETDADIAKIREKYNL